MKETMKKLLLAAAALAACIGMNAQTSQARNEFSVGYSQFTVLEGAYLFGGIFGAAFSLGHFTFDNTVMTGALSLEYHHYTNDWFGYGGLVAAEYITSDSYSVDGDGNKTPNGKYNMGLASAAPLAIGKWLRREKFNLYSKLAAGVGLTFDGQVIPFFQVSPLCIDFGPGQGWNGFVETGFGMQGLVTAGIKKKF